MTPGARTFAVLGLLAVFADAQAQSRIAATVTDERGKPLVDAVIVAVPLDMPLRPPAKPREDAIFQVDKEFVPRVSVVLAGTAIAFPNNDDVRHHVYSFSPAKRFELPLYQGMPPHPVVFDKPGVVVLGCNIHDWMVAYVYVSESPHHAMTDGEGRAVLDDLPARSYAVRVWHAQLEGDEEATRRTIDLSRTRSVEVAWSLKLKPELRVRRAPATMRQGNY